MGGARATASIRSRITMIDACRANLFEKSRLELKRFYEHEVLKKTRESGAAGEGNCSFTLSLCGRLRFRSSGRRL